MHQRPSKHLRNSLTINVFLDINYCVCKTLKKAKKTQ